MDPSLQTGCSVSADQDSHVDGGGGEPEERLAELKATGGK